MKKIFLPALIILLASVAFAQEQQAQMTYAHSPIKCVLKNYFSIKNTSNREVVDLKIKVLVGHDDSLYQEPIETTVTPEPTEWNTDQLGNKYAIIDVKSLPAGREQQVIIERSSVNYAIAFDKSIYDIKDDFSDFLENPKNLQYLLPSKGIESDNEIFITDVKDIDNSYSATHRAFGIFTYVNISMTYDTDTRYANTSALVGRTSKRGVCTEFAGVFVALCRANGIPARIVSGYWPQKDFRSGVEETFASSARHSWAEFYVPTVGWVPAEPSSISMLNDIRVSSYNDFAAISPNSRHYVYSYGLEKEKNGNIAINYSYLGEKTNATLVSVSLFKESITATPYEE